MIETAFKEASAFNSDISKWSVPGDITLSGSTLSQDSIARMGTYLWLGSFKNGKPYYVRLHPKSNGVPIKEFLYWHSGLNNWFISRILGKASGYFKFPIFGFNKKVSTNTDFSDPHRTYKNGNYKYEYITITSSKACAVTRCGASTGYYCYASGNRCEGACSNNRGLSVNDNDCTCGTTDCTTSSGRFCLSSTSTCSIVAICTPTQVANSNKADTNSITGTIGQTTTVVCNPGYVGGGTATCNKNGQFNHSACMAIVTCATTGGSDACPSTTTAVSVTSFLSL